MNSLMNVRFINEHNEIVNEPNEIMVVHGILSQKTLQTDWPCSGSFWTLYLDP